jgi:hypothetical protein
MLEFRLKKIYNEFAGLPKAGLGEQITTNSQYRTLMPRFKHRSHQPGFHRKPSVNSHCHQKGGVESHSTYSPTDQ